jgi:hypothetical protein
MNHGRFGSVAVWVLMYSMASSAIAVIRFQPGLPSYGWIGVVLRNRLPGCHWLVSPPTKP